MICSGIKKILDEYKYDSFEKGLKYVYLQAAISFIFFIFQFIGLGDLFKNIVISIIWFNIGAILEILSVVKILEGSSEILAEKLCNDEAIQYRKKAGIYIIIYSIVVILCNINFVFMAKTIVLISGIIGLIIKVWIMFSLKNLSKD